MRLMRNQMSRRGICKYALIRTDKLSDQDLRGIFDDAEGSKQALVKILQDRPDLIEFGAPESENEFFTIKLKDVNAGAALLAYSQSAELQGDPHLSQDVLDLANRAGIRSKFTKKPD